MTSGPQQHTDDGPDLTICDREPIHIPGSVESNGVLLAFREQELTLAQVSENVATHIGVEPEALLDAPFDKLFEGDSFTALRQHVMSGSLDHRRKFLSGMRVRGSDRTFDASLHRHDGVLIIEMEPAADHDAAPPAAIHSLLTDALSSLDGHRSLVDLCQQVAVQVRRLTEFDRVMVYLFLEDSTGAVIGEARRADLVPYSGLRYPASDIPAQARRLYLLNALRLKADVNREPSPLVPALNPATGQPLDMTYCVLRAMSPVHVEYMRNMDVTASMSVSIVKDERLWGLVACHHKTAKTVPFHIRAACDILARVFSAHIAAAEEEDTRRSAAGLRQFCADLAEKLRAASDVRSALIERGDGIAKSIGAGAAVCIGDEISLFGDTPGLEQVGGILRWLDGNQRDYIFHTERLSEHCPAGEGIAETATGLLSVRIALRGRDCILWFRPPTVKVVEWGGNPAKPVKETEAGKRISPRLSFERWTETVGDQSEPWRAYEREFALDVRQTVVELLLVQQNAQVIRLNLELERSNIELDAFAYAASHDLQEPVRTLRSYAQLLARRAAARLSAEDVELLKVIEAGAIRMGSLISALLGYAQVGGSHRRERKLIEMNDVLRWSLLNLDEAIRASGATVTHDPLPVVNGDAEQITQLLQNLVGNALKYRRLDEPLHVHVSAVHDDGMWRFGVDDNAQGFEPEEAELIFLPFRRLHGRDTPGTGIGLATCKRIVEHHGVAIWAEGRGRGRGATFWFTLPGAGR